MTECKYLERIIYLAEQLGHAGAARPYDPDSYNAIVDELNKLHAARFRRRRRRSWMMITIIVVLAVFFGLLVVKILYIIIF